MSIDGRFDDEIWREVTWHRHFRQSLPEYGAVPSEETRVAFVFDDSNLYIAVECNEADIENIFATRLSHRDHIRRDDFVEIVLDTYRDQVRGYLFCVNPLGAKDESQINGAGDYNWDWNEVWEVATTINQYGWQAEFRIPLSILSFSTTAGSNWGVNVRRVLRSRNEHIYLSPPPPPHDISSLNYTATLDGLPTLHNQRNIQVIPYVLFKGSEDEYGQGSTDENMGADVKYAISSDLTLDLTYNTDFAQVEADNVQVNLSRYSLFFPEKRNFFLENAQLFTMNRSWHGRSLMPFFSRRIGLHDGEQVPIRYGSRLSGKVSGFDVGVLAIQTDEVEDLDLDSGLYSVMRLRKNISGRSYVGGIMTTSDRGDFNSRTYGIDGKWYFNERLSAYAYYTAVEQDDIVSAADAYAVNIDYTSDAYGFGLKTSRVGENYQPDLGYVPRAGIRTNSASVRRSWRFTDSPIRRISTRLSTSWTYTPESLTESASKRISLDLETESGERFDYDFRRSYEQLFNTFAINDEITFAAGEYDYFNIHCFSAAVWAAAGVSQAGSIMVVILLARAGTSARE